MLYIIAEMNHLRQTSSGQVNGLTNQIGICKQKQRFRGEDHIVFMSYLVHLLHFRNFLRRLRNAAFFACIEPCRLLPGVRRSQPHRAIEVRFVYIRRSR